MKSNEMENPTTLPKSRTRRTVRRLSCGEVGLKLQQYTYIETHVRDLRTGRDGGAACEG